MLNFRENTSNIFAVTLAEKTTISNPYYLFEFENRITNEKSYCIPTDTSNYKYRYNLFTVTETSNPTPTSGEVDLTGEGHYNYTVYEQDNNTNLDPTGLTIVEQGFMYLGEGYAEYTKYTNEAEYVQYNG